MRPILLFRLITSRSKGVRYFSMAESGGKTPTKKSSRVPKDKIAEEKIISKKSNDSLEIPGKPSSQYEAPQYFNYNQYSYNDLINEMERFRIPQPVPK